MDKDGTSQTRVVQTGAGFGANEGMPAVPTTLSVFCPHNVVN